MTAYFVTRHAGALDWAKLQGIEAEHILHLDPSLIKPGDKILGTVPVSVAAEICARGGRYFHLSLNIPSDARGRELSALDLDNYGAKLEEYTVRRAEGE